MALVVGTNSWVTVAEADTYLTDRLGTQDWFTLDESPSAPGEPSKDTFLITAFNLLVNKGGYCLDPAMTDNRVKNSQSELAFYFVNNYNQFIADSDSISKGLKKFDLSEWSEEYFESWKGDFPLPASVSVFLTVYRSDNLITFLEVE